MHRQYVVPEVFQIKTHANLPILSRTIAVELTHGMDSITVARLLYCVY